MPLSQPLGQPIREFDAVGPAEWAEIAASGKPAVLRGLTADWPLIAETRDGGAEAALAYLANLDSGAQTDVMIAPASEGGRFFYRDDMRGFNFQRDKATLSKVAAELLKARDSAEPPTIYAGATATAQHLPSFDAANPMPLLKSETDAQSRVWLGNASQVTTHFDLSDNVAVVACGKRRFTLFPPQATPDLYVGPLNITMAGQPVSMVDPLSPDMDRYPRFEAAEELALSAELGPGDAIFIPTMWWHHVSALDPVNVLVNYWYRDAQNGGPFLAFIHALWAIRDLPDSQRDAWRSWFDHFIFGPDAHSAADHIPPHAQGVNGSASPQRSEMMRQFILKALSQS